MQLNEVYCTINQFSSGDFLFIKNAKPQKKFKSMDCICETMEDMQSKLDNRYCVLRTTSHHRQLMMARHFLYRPYTNFFQDPFLYLYTILFRLCMNDTAVGCVPSYAYIPHDRIKCI